MHLKDRKKMLWIIGFWATISNVSIFENKGFRYFLLTQQFFWYFYHQYLTHVNSKAYWTYHFLKELRNIFQVHLNILSKLGLSFCYQQKIQQMSHFWSLMTINLGVNIITKQITPFFSSTLWALSVVTSHFCI